MKQTEEMHEIRQHSEFCFKHFCEDGETVGEAKISIFDKSLNEHKDNTAVYVRFKFMGMNEELQIDNFYKFCDFIEDLKGELCRIEKQTQKNAR